MRIKTFLTLAVLALCFVLLPGCSPSTRAAETIVSEKNMKVLIVGDAGIGRTAVIEALAQNLGAKTVLVVAPNARDVVRDIVRADAAPAVPIISKFVLEEFIVERSERIPIVNRTENLQSGKLSNYKSPSTDFERFTGFDQPARGKI